jgi:hypothetical protein
MKRRVLTGVFLFAVVVVVALFSLVWAAWLFLSALAVWLWRLSHKFGPWLKFACVVMLAVLAASMWVAGKTPAHVNMDSAASSRLPWGFRLTAPPPDHEAASRPPQLDEVVQVRDDFRRAAFRLRAQANAVEPTYVGDVRCSAGRSSSRSWAARRAAPRSSETAPPPLLALL